MGENIFVAVSVAAVWLVIRLIACFRVYDDAKARGMMKKYALDDVVETKEDWE